MTMTVVVALLLLTALGLVLRGRISYIPENERERARNRYSRENYEPKPTTLDLRPFAVIPILLALGALALTTSYKVGTGEAVIKVSPGGAYLATVDATGYHMKAPWTGAETWDLRNNRVEFNGGKDADSDTIRTATSDPVDTSFDMTVTYDLQPSGLRNAYQQYRNQDRLEAEQIVPAFSSKAKDAPTKYPATRIRASRPELSQAIRSDLTTRLASFGVNVSNVDLQTINLPRNVVDNMNKVQAAAAAAEAKRSELAVANIDAEKTRVAAKGDADADQITRCGATTEVKTEQVNGKDTQVTRVIPNPTCDPNRLNNAVLAARYIDMLSKRGGDTTMVLPDNVTPLLNLGAPKAR